MVRLLGAAVRYGRNQQQLLSPAQGRNLRYVARAGPHRFLLCRQGDPLNHAGKEAQGLPGAASAHDRADKASAISAGSAPLKATAVVERKSKEHTYNLKSLMRISYSVFYV